MHSKKRKVTSGKQSAAGRALKATNRLARKATIAKGKLPESGLRHIAWSAIEDEALNPLLFRRFVVGQNVMVARLRLMKGCLVPQHSHYNEQISCVLEGALKFVIGGKEIVVHAGEVLAIPPNLPHSAEALADTVAHDVFNPPRADWINKTDSYLR